MTSPITVGFLLPAADQSESAAQFGATNNNTVGPRGMAMALVKYLNDHGGLSGRRIRPIYTQISSSSTSFEQSFQQVCTTFTQDNKVEAVINLLAYSSQLGDCLRKRQVPHILGLFSGTDVSEFDKGLLYAPYALSDDTRYRLVLEHHAATGYLSSTTRIGILKGGCANDERAYQRTVVPTLARLGLKPVSEFTVRCVSGSGDTGGAVGDLQAAVLRFKNDNVNRIVLISNDEANGVYLFSTQAEAQFYRPGYAVSSSVAGAVSRPNMPPGQQENIHGVGWNPSLDDEQTMAPTAVEKLCLSTLASEGQRAVTATDRYFAYATCGAVYFYAAALRAANGRSAAGDIDAAVASLGTSFRPPGVLNGAARFTSSRPFGPTLARTFSYVTACKCLRYSGATTPIS